MMNAEKIRKDLVKADPEDLPGYQSKPRIDTPNTHGHSDKKRQTIESGDKNE